MHFSFGIMPLVVDVCSDLVADSSPVMISNWISLTESGGQFA